MASRVKKPRQDRELVPPRRIIEKKFGFRAPSRSGDDVIRCESLRKAYGARTIHDGLPLDSCAARSGGR